MCMSVSHHVASIYPGVRQPHYAIRHMSKVVIENLNMVSFVDMTVAVEYNLYVPGLPPRSRVSLCSLI